MPGKVTFIFDDGLASAYHTAYPIFKERSISGCIAVCADFTKNEITREQALAMQKDGWEIMSHGIRHIHMNEEISEEQAREEIISSKEKLEEAGFQVKQFVTPMSECNEKWFPLLYSAYDAAYTVYKNSGLLSVEELVIAKPVQHYELHRTSLSGKTLAQLKEYVDHIWENDEWMVFYDHEIGAGENITDTILSELLDYIIEKGVKVLTGSQVMDHCLCKTHRIRSGYDGERCMVHARCCTNANQLFFATAQYLDVKGCDLFSGLMFSKSKDGGKSFAEFRSDPGFAPTMDQEGNYIYGCDATPMYHKKTGKFMVIGQTVRYSSTSMSPIPGERKTFYAVFDSEKDQFNPIKFIEMPDKEKFFNAGNGSGQSIQFANGELLVPIYYKQDISAAQYSSCVMRCSFDGETMEFIECGNSLTKANEPRGVYEPSIIYFKDKYYMTLRGDNHGYHAVSDDGINFSDLSLWRWDNGEVLPNYNTQQHWMVCGAELFLVYTRKAGTNDHVFRHRAPLFVARVNIEDMSLIRESEFIAVPERGARLGNFGVFSESENKAFIMAAEWMQPRGCESYGSNNSIYLTEINMEDHRSEN